ncbi:MAG: ribosome maturation factor RimP [Gammaproteobacteria bacterium]|nr:ribosome maturation factor RimP [Gammaproteobacteria bacterium]MDH5593154.1 ribosome maturation factor RimP [Gammaproteobacteria bacterium]
MGQAPQFRALFEPAITAMGYELVGVEYLRQGKQGLLRIYIDSENGITVDDCGKVSHQVSGILEVEDPIRENYVLEVSSPGLDRPLYTAEHFVRFAGSKARIRTRMPFEGRRNYTGVLHGVDDDHVVIDVDDEEYRLPINEIEKANLVPEI